MSKVELAPKDQNDRASKSANALSTATQCAVQCVELSGALIGAAKSDDSDCGKRHLEGRICSDPIGRANPVRFHVAALNSAVRKAEEAIAPLSEHLACVYDTVEAIVPGASATSYHGMAVELAGRVHNCIHSAVATTKDYEQKMTAFTRDKVSFPDAIAELAESNWPRVAIQLRRFPPFAIGRLLAMIRKEAAKAKGDAASPPDKLDDVEPADYIPVSSCVDSDFAPYDAAVRRRLKADSSIRTSKGSAGVLVHAADWARARQRYLKEKDRAQAKSKPDAKAIAIIAEEAKTREPNDQTINLAKKMLNRS